MKNRPVELTPVLGMEAREADGHALVDPAVTEAEAALALRGRAGRGRRGEGVERAVAGRQDQVAVGRDRGGRSCLPDPPEVAIRVGVEDGDELQRLRVVADEPAVVRVEVALRGEAREDDAVGMPRHLGVEHQAGPVELPQRVERDHPVGRPGAGAGDGDRGVVGEAAVGVERRVADRDRAAVPSPCR